MSYTKMKAQTKREEIITILARADRSLPSNASKEARLAAYEDVYPWKTQHKQPPKVWHDTIDEHLYELAKLSAGNGK